MRRSVGLEPDAERPLARLQAAALSDEHKSCVFADMVDKMRNYYNSNREYPYKDYLTEYWAHDAREARIFAPRGRISYFSWRL